MGQSAKAQTNTPPRQYLLDTQIGFILRQVVQRHVMIFAKEVGTDLTTTQWAVLAKLAEVGSCSQNQLGRLTAMDAATVKGVLDRLSARRLTKTSPDSKDGRRLVATLTNRGADLVENTLSKAHRATKETLAPLTSKERATLTALLLKIR